MANGRLGRRVAISRAGARLGLRERLGRPLFVVGWLAAAFVLVRAISAGDDAERAAYLVGVAGLSSHSALSRKAAIPTYLGLIAATVAAVSFAAKGGLGRLASPSPAVLGIAAATWRALGHVLARARRPREAVPVDLFGIVVAAGTAAWLFASLAVRLAWGDGPSPMPSVLAERPLEATVGFAGLLAAAALSTRAIGRTAGLTSVYLCGLGLLLAAHVSFRPEVSRTALALEALVYAQLWLGAGLSPAGAAGLAATATTGAAVAAALAEVRSPLAIATLYAGGIAAWWAATSEAWRHAALACGGIAIYATLDRFLPLDAAGASHPIAFAAVALALGLGANALASRRAAGDVRRSLRAAAVVQGLLVAAFVGLSLATKGLSRPFDAGETVAGTALLLGLVVLLAEVARHERSETFVDAAELALALGFVFVKLARPELFEAEVFRRFWPLVVVAFAFAMVGAATLLERLRLSLFARPAFRTAAIVPLIPLAGVWFLGKGLSAGTFLTAAAFYGVLASVRGRPVFLYFACLLANIGLQPFLLAFDLSYASHPEMFFAPAGLSLVAAAHLGRRHFGRDTASALRTAGSLIIFASLTVALYVDLANRVLESVVLAAICIAGVVAGIALRIRAYLHMGAAFLALDVATQIFWAGRDHVWVWWASLVALGIATIAHFTYSERKEAALRAAGARATRLGVPPHPDPLPEGRGSEA